MQRGQLAGVPLDADEAVYSALLNSVDEGQQDEVDEGPGQVSSLETMQPVAQGDAPSRPAGRKRKQVSSQSGAKAKARRDWVQVMYPILAEEAEQEHSVAGSSGQLPGQSPLAAANPVVVGGSSSSTAAPAPVQPGQPGQPSAMVQLSRDRQHTTLEGVSVIFDKHGFRGQRGAYERLIAFCPKCKVQVQRSFSAKFSKVSGLGDLEPYAFIGCWLSRCSSFSSKAEHKAWKPTVEDVKAYAAGQSWS